MPRSLVHWTTRDRATLAETLKDMTFRKRWARFKANVTVLHMGMWDIIKTGLGTVDPVMFLWGVKTHIREFTIGARETLPVAEWDQFNSRMEENHMFVLVAPKRCEVVQNLMPTPLYEEYRKRITEVLNKNKQTLFEVSYKVALCSPAQFYGYRIHQYICRLVCWSCRPTYKKYTLQLQELAIGGCDDQYNEFWPDITDLTANVKPKPKKRHQRR